MEMRDHVPVGLLIWRWLLTSLSASCLVVTVPGWAGLAWASSGGGESGSFVWPLLILQHVIHIHYSGISALC